MKRLRSSSVYSVAYRRPYSHAATQVHSVTRKHRWLWLIAVPVCFMLFDLSSHSSVPFFASIHSFFSQTNHTVRAVSPLTHISVETMNHQIESAIAANPGVDITVSCIDLKTHAVYENGTSDGFEAASIGKFITAAALLHSVEAGRVSLSETLDQADDSGDTTASAELQAMVVDSDNSAWQAINDRLGRDNVQSYAASIGLDTYDPSINILSAHDVAVVLQKLYTGVLLNRVDSSLLLHYMAHANEAEFIIPAVPPGVTVYHKAGLLEDRIHDAAIIDNGKAPYILVVMTNGHGTYDTPARQQLIQTVTKATVSYFIGS